MLVRRLVGLLGICLAPCSAYTAVGRFGHSAVLVNDSIYFYGGDSSITASQSTPLWISDMAVLPINIPFPLTDPPWRASSGPQSALGGPVVYAHTAFVGGLDGTNMTLVGGLMPATEKQASDDQTTAYSYNCQSGTWSTVNLPSNNFLSRQGAASSVTSDGIAHIWGGKRASANKTSTGTSGYRPHLPASMYRLDTLNPSNSSFTPPTSPTPPLRYAHTQTLIRDRKIVVLGGFDGLTGQAISMADIWIFDTVDQEWSHVNATLDKDNKPANRSSHSQVLMPDGQSILIYGGYDGYHVFNDVAVLDTNTWTWTIKNTNAAVQGRADHTATLVGTNMIVAFGFTGVSTALTVLSDIEVLDINRWSWTSTYAPSGEYTTIGGPNVNFGDQGHSPDTLPSTPSMAIVAGAVTGVLVVFVLIVIAVYMFNYHQKRQRRSEQEAVQRATETAHRERRRSSSNSSSSSTTSEQSSVKEENARRGMPMPLGRAPTRLHVVTHSPIPQPPPFLASPWKPPVRQSFPPASSEWVVRRAATAPQPYLRHTISKPDEPSAIRLWVRRAATTPRAASNLKPDSSEDDESVFDQQQFILRNEDSEDIGTKHDKLQQQQRDDENAVVVVEEEQQEDDAVTIATTPEGAAALGKVSSISKPRCS